MFHFLRSCVAIIITVGFCLPMARSQSIFNGTDLTSKMRGLLCFMSLAQFPFSQSLSSASTTPRNSSILSTDGFSSPSLSYSAAQKAVCVTGYLDVPVQATTTEILYDGPTNNTQLTSLLISLFALDSTVAGSLASSVGRHQYLTLIPFTRSFACLQMLLLKALRQFSS
jgi:hypothetical protein